jgi:predicted ABC-type ATPase
LYICTYDLQKTLCYSGCNGAGKTTASFTILPEILDCKEFINADEIARGISPFQPDKVSFEAGRIMLNRINELLYRSENPEVIERRYIRGIKNLFNIYLPIVDKAFIFDNSEGKHKLLANKQMNNLLNTVDIEGFNLLKKYNEND